MPYVHDRRRAIKIRKNLILLLGELKFLFYFSRTSVIAYDIKIIILMTHDRRRATEIK